ncbi:hypothetical protein AWENTII_007637 [Aspergillus wentii]
MNSNNPNITAQCSQDFNSVQSVPFSYSCGVPRFTTTNATNTTEILESCCNGPVAVHGDPDPCWIYCNGTKQTVDQTYKCLIHSNAVPAAMCNEKENGTSRNGVSSVLGMVLGLMLFMLAVL